MMQKVALCVCVGSLILSSSDAAVSPQIQSATAAGSGPHSKNLNWLAQQTNQAKPPVTQTGTGKGRLVLHDDPEGIPPSWKARRAGHAFTKEAAVTVTWNYNRADTTNGPYVWGNAYPICYGSLQSPIDIVNDAAIQAYPSAQYDSTLAPLSVNWNTYSSATTIVENNGHSIEILPAATDLSSTFTGGPLKDTYSMTQFHFHQGSEHTLNGASFPVELHILGTTENAADASSGPSNLAVLGIFFAEDPNPSATANTGLTSILAAITAGTLSTLGNTAPISLSLSSLWNTTSANNYFTYQGSLTTPPCTQDVIWSLLQQPLLVPGNQLQQLRTFLANPEIGPNVNRPQQPLNGRIVRTNNPPLN